MLQANFFIANLEIKKEKSEGAKDLILYRQIFVRSVFVRAVFDCTVVTWVFFALINHDQIYHYGIKKEIENHTFQQTNMKTGHQTDRFERECQVQIAW